jgi:hypothetical protein
VVPNEFVAVSVYEVVTDGFTPTDVPVTAPTPELMASDVAPDTVQLSVLVWPGVTFAGAALKLLMTGAVPAVTVTTAVVDPAVFVAVSV